MPFKGVISRDAGEPWGATGMTTERWMQLPTESVRIGELWATQPGVFFAPLIDPNTPPYSRDPIPHVVEWRGERYLEDGHHRLTRAALRGESRIEARILRVDS